MYMLICRFFYCQQNQAEKENISLYDELFAGTDEQDVLAVFQRLQGASRDNHLPVFRRCLERGAQIQKGDGINSRGSGTLHETSIKVKQ